MTPFDFWPWTARLPLGGDVAQAIAPLTNLFSPTVELNFAGNRRIEGDVVCNVASYGKQLGILTDAVLALGGDDRSDAVQRLRDLADRIETRKQQHKDDVRQQAKTALEALIKADPGALHALLDEFAGRSGKPT
ncbi:MAG: hypothetical protein KIT36_10450 [Alphaproteobacteria bacterium]|nr:hypothetical protein [Alphaproteobacteria bacterium]